MVVDAVLVRGGQRGRRLDRGRGRVVVVPEQYRCSGDPDPRRDRRGAASEDQPLKAADASLLRFHVRWHVYGARHIDQHPGELDCRGGRSRSFRHVRVHQAGRHFLRSRRRVHDDHREKARS